MNAVTEAVVSDLSPLTADIRAEYETACGLVAPTWPLDQLIAVNPFWELRDHRASDVAARISALVHGHMLMPPSYYAELEDSLISDRHLEAAATELGVERRPAASLDDNNDAPANWHNISDLLDSSRDRLHEVAWRDEIIHQISQFCAAVLKDRGDDLQSNRPGSLYKAWLDSVQHDIGIPILMGERTLGRQFDQLPEDPDTLIAQATSEIGVPTSAAELYAHALLLDVNGWASWIAYRRWQARLKDRHEDLSWDLLAIRMGWELVLWRHVAATDAAAAQRLDLLWQRQVAAPDLMLKEHATAQKQAWLWQRAEELAFQEHVAKLLGNGDAAQDDAASRPQLQAAFCIDVRSEVYRRHLEARDTGIQTLGFAGFFGLPLEYRPKGSDLSRPQLPGLLAPAIQVSEATDDALPESVERRARWRDLGEAPPAMFGLVEASGPWYAAKLLKNAFFPSVRKHPVNSLHPDAKLVLTRDGEGLAVDERTDLAAVVLHAMGLEHRFAPIVLLVGHGSTSRNNPHAAGLDCGACGGQTGELNSRALADLLNDTAVRDALTARGIDIPADTRFVAALHNTTTDEISTHCGDTPLPKNVRRWLDAASRSTREERAAKLDLPGDADHAEALVQRSQDWSQVRPEWGLAGNAAFIAAPRRQTAGRDLEGRAFLHDYDWRNDADNGVLELIMTAPMVVAHWINMQYNASVTDNVRYGSGNKVLHNVVGGNLGVFEGNGGDLRIGLPLQSVHDGEHWMHTPLRLSAYIAAPADAIQSIYEKHEVVRQLVDNDWLYLFRLDELGGVTRLYRDRWIDKPLETV
ncbi:MAG: DUF2309 domain-containing protein [Pseudomonadota bacterium]